MPAYFFITYMFLLFSSENTVVLKDSGESVGTLCIWLVTSVWKMPVLTPRCIACYRMSKENPLRFCLFRELESQKGNVAPSISTHHVLEDSKEAHRRKGNWRRSQREEASLKRVLQAWVSPIDVTPAIGIA